MIYFKAKLIHVIAAFFCILLVPIGQANNSSNRVNTLWILFYFESSDCIVGDLYLDSERIGYAVITSETARESIKELDNKIYKTEVIAWSSNYITIHIKDKDSDGVFYSFTLGEVGEEANPDIGLVESVGSACSTIPGDALSRLQEKMRASQSADRAIEFFTLLAPLDLTGHWEGHLRISEASFKTNVLLAGDDYFYTGYTYVEMDPIIPLVTTLKVYPNRYSVLKTWRDKHVITTLEGFVSINGKELDLNNQLDGDMDITNAKDDEESPMWLVVTKAQEPTVSDEEIVSPAQNRTVKPDGLVNPHPSHK